MVEKYLLNSSVDYLWLNKIKQTYVFPIYYSLDNRGFEKQFLPDYLFFFIEDSVQTPRTDDCYEIILF